MNTYAFKLNPLYSKSKLSLSRCLSSVAPTIEQTPKKRILSGVQPTGALHLGNQLGAIKQWVNFQHTYDSYFCVVDLHAITVPQDPIALRRDSLQTAAMYIASGIDPKKSHVFIQSHVTAHAELAWIFNCITPLNWLERMIQYKEKAVKHGENVSVGLLSYPILMAADILLYQPDYVPVGEDQRQHLELARDIARKFNHQFETSTKGKKGKDKQQIVFKEPEALIVKEGARVMSLIDGTNKMSKSHENDASRINLLDSTDVIVKKIKRCKTDSDPYLEWNNPNRPEACNLLTIYQAVTDKTQDQVLQDIQGLKWGQFKPLLTDAIVSYLTPIQQRYHEIIQDQTMLETILSDGQEKANEVAQETLQQVKDAVGLYSIPKKR